MDVLRDCPHGGAVQEREHDVAPVNDGPEMKSIEDWVEAEGPRKRDHGVVCSSKMRCRAGGFKKGARERVKRCTTGNKPVSA